MNNCKAIPGLVLDEYSLQHIRLIRARAGLTSYMGVALAGGFVMQMFTKSTVLATANNIRKSDWDLFFQAMGGLPDLTQRIIKDHAVAAVLHYHFSGGKRDPKIIAFWTSIDNGCKI